MHGQCQLATPRSGATFLMDNRCLEMVSIVACLEERERPLRVLSTIPPRGKRPLMP